MDDHKIWYGQNIRFSDRESLMTTSLQGIADLIADVKSELADECRKLRNLLRLDKSAYNKAKLVLPYICGSEFRNAIRHTDNFITARWMIADFDDCAGSVKELEELRDKMAGDDQSALVYLSPSKRGIKVVFGLDEPIADADFYSRFYRYHVSGFAEKYGLTGKADLKTCDVARVSFLSSDEGVKYNASFKTVSYGNFKALTDYGKHVAIEAGDSAQDSNQKEKKISAEDVYDHILKKLGSRPGRTRPERNIFVPEILSDVQALIIMAISPHGIDLEESRPIQYGMKYVFRHGQRKAELNVFYGKKGFSVVISPKTGTDDKLNKVVHALVFNVLFGIEEAMGFGFNGNQTDLPL